MNRFILIRVSVLPNRDFFVPKLSGLWRHKRKRGSESYSFFFWKTVYGYPYTMLAKDIFVMTVKFRFWFSDYEQKKFCRCKHSVWVPTHEKRRNEQKRVFCSLVIYSLFDFLQFIAFYFSFWAIFLFVQYFYIGKC